MENVKRNLPSLNLLTTLYPFTLYLVPKLTFPTAAGSEVSPQVGAAPSRHDDGMTGELHRATQRRGG